MKVPIGQRSLYKMLSLLVIALMLFVVACGGEEPETETEPTTDGTNAAEPAGGIAETPAGGEQRTPAASGEPITIGSILDLTGALAHFGEQESKAAQLFVKQQNAKGGVLGRPLELIIRDGKTSPDEAVSQARDLLFSQDVHFLMQGINSAEAIAVSPLAEQDKTIVFSQAGADAFTMEDGHEYAFRVPNVISRTQAYSAVQYAQKHFPDARRYYLIAHDYAFGRNVIDVFKNRIKEVNPSVEFVGEAYPKMTETDYNSYITAILQAKPDVVFFAWSTGIPFFKQAAAFNLSEQVNLLSAYWGGVEELMLLDQQSIPSGAVVGGIPWYGIDTPENKAFVDAFKQEYDSEPAPSAYFDYASLQFLVAAIEKAGTTDTDRVIAALEGMSLNTPMGEVTIRPFDHQGTSPYWLGKAAWDEQLNIGVITEIENIPTDEFLPSEEEIQQMRGGGS